MNTHEQRKRLRNQLNIGKIGSFNLARVQVQSPIPFEELTGKSRLTRIKTYRQVTQTLLFASGVTYSEIGRIYGKGHDSIIHSVKVVSDMISIKDKEYIQAINKMCENKEFYVQDYMDKPTEFVISQLLLQKKFYLMS